MLLKRPVKKDELSQTRPQQTKLVTVISQDSEKKTIGNIDQTNRVQIKLLKNHEIENSHKPKNFGRSWYIPGKGW